MFKAQTLNLTIDYWPLNLKPNYFLESFYPNLESFYTLLGFPKNINIYSVRVSNDRFPLCIISCSRILYMVPPKVIPCDIQVENWLETFSGSHIFFDTRPTLEFTWVLTLGNLHGNSSFIILKCF
jgi:hypothetical protein